MRKNFAIGILNAIKSSTTENSGSLIFKNNLHLQ